MGILFFLLGLGLMMGAQKANKFVKNSLRNARKVNGQLVAHIKKYTGSRALNPLIKVHVDGVHRYLLSPIGSNPPSGSIGDSVDVYLDPKDSNRAMTQLAFVPKVCSVVTLIGILICAASIYAIWVSVQNGFPLIDLGVAVFVLSAIGFQYKKVTGSKSERTRKIRELIRNASVFVNFVSEEDALEMLAGQHEPKEKFVKMRSIEQHKRQKRSEGVGRFAGYAIGLVGLAAISFAVMKAQETFEFKGRGIQVPGQITDKKVNRGSSTTYTPIITYRAQNESLDRKMKGGFASSHPSWSVGDPVSVLYDPEDPGNAIQEDGLWNYMFSLLFAGLGFFFAMLGWAALPDKNTNPQGSRSKYRHRAS